MWSFGEMVTGKGHNHPSVTERYTDATRRALDLAHQEAANRGAREVTVADLLAGLSLDDSSRAERIGSLKDNAFYLRWLAGLPALPAVSPAPDSGDGSHLELDADAKRAVAYAVLEADRDRNYWVDSDHLLRGLLRFPNKANFAVLKTELNLKSARHASRIDREAHAPAENPNLKVIQYLARKYAALLLPPMVSLACYLYILIQGIGQTVAPLAH